MPADVQVLCQIANGIDHLHANDVSHGNLNPQTILISQSQPVRIKISDCGLSRYFWDELDGISHPQYWRRGTNDATVNGDVFAAGCLLFYFLTSGLHPFGRDLKSILENISKSDPVRLGGDLNSPLFNEINDLILIFTFKRTERKARYRIRTN